MWGNMSKSAIINQKDQIHEELRVQVEECKAIAAKMRQMMISKACSINGNIHWGSILSCTEVLTVLYHVIMKQDNCKDDDKDKFLLSKGHASLALYTIMNIEGILSDDIYHTYRDNGSSLSELAHYDKKLGIEVSGGSLGIAPSYGVGLALLAKKRSQSYHTYVLVGDGEIDEGNVWEAIMFAAQSKLDNFTLIIDANGIQSDGYTKEILSWENIKCRLESFGFETYSVDGHNCLELINAFSKSENKDCPKAIIANTTKGKGISFMENNYLWHDNYLKGTELDVAKSEVGLNA